MRTRLENASPSEQLIESLIPMWEEERSRCTGDLPKGPPSPPRTPGPLCQTVEDVRAQFQVCYLPPPPSPSYLFPHPTCLPIQRLVLHPLNPAISSTRICSV